MGKKSEKQTAVLKKMVPYIRKNALFLFFSLAFAAVSAVFALYVPILTGQAIDCILGPQNVDFTGIFEILGKMAAVIGVTALAQWMMNICKIGRAHV